MKIKYVLALGAASIFVGGLLLMNISNQSATLVSEQPPENLHETLGGLLEEGNYDGALAHLEGQRNEISATEFSVQKNRIQTIRAYDDFYSLNNNESRTKMLNGVINTINSHFDTVASSTTGNSDKAKALNTVAFLYSETWSDPTLLKHIASKLGINDFDINSNLQNANVFAELFQKSIDFFPTQDAYLKRAWFNSRLLLTDISISNDKRNEIVQSIKDDVTTSNAAEGMKFNSASRYYNSYTALAYADVLDFLYQEKALPDYSSVEIAYTQALSLSDSDFFGNLIIQDIVRMNYAASLYRSDTVGAQYEMIVSLLRPVAEHIKTYSREPAVAYEGILVMLRAIPLLQNQNNASVHAIFLTTSEFAEIPTLLGWDPEAEPDAVTYVYKLI